MLAAVMHVRWGCCYRRALNNRLSLEKPQIECEWRDGRNRYPSATRVPVIDQHIAIGRTGDGHDYRWDYENEFGAFVEPCIPELLRAPKPDRSTRHSLSDRVPANDRHRIASSGL